MIQGEVGVDLGSSQFPQARRYLVMMMFQQQRLSLCAKPAWYVPRRSALYTRNELWMAVDTLSRQIVALLMPFELRHPGTAHDTRGGRFRGLRQR
jgi:hypothetical protein